MRIIRNWVLLVASGGLVFGALAAGVVYIFSMKSHFPWVTYEYDKEVNFPHAGKLPILYLNVGATKIKKGDILRVIYPDGRVFDIETTAQCSATMVCPLGYPTQKSAANAPANVSNYQRTSWEKEVKDTCSQDARRDFATGYWATNLVELPPLPDGTQTFVHTDTWVSTGTQTLSTRGGRCK